MVAAPLCALVMLAPGAGLARAATPEPNSADRLITWTKCDEVVALTDAELDTWKARGVDGFVCMTKQLWGMGGDQNFTGNPTEDLNRSEYALQRDLRDSAIVARANARGMKMYLGAKLVNYYNPATPLRDWYDDRGWSQVVLPAMRNLAGAARQLGFAGLAFDQELYRQAGGVQTASWAWDYPGSTRAEQDVRTKATQRGQEVMTQIVSAFPGAELLAYDVRVPETWSELVQQEINADENAYSRRLDIDFWDGLLSVNGYGAVRWLDATFYKSAHRGNWDRALRYNYNRLFSFLSRRLSNWGYASSRLNVSPFSWIDPGPSSSAFDDARQPAYVAEQLLAFRRWGMGGEFANYAYGGLRSFDYSPYVSAIQAASTRAVVDSEAPALTVSETGTAPTRRASTELQGTANDNLAVRSVRWASDRGHDGMAGSTWRIESGDSRSGYTGKTTWSIPGIRLEPGYNRITIEAEDIKGLTTSSTVIVRRTGESSNRDDKRQVRTKKRARRRCAQRARSRHLRGGRRVMPRRCAPTRLRSL